MTSSTPSLAQQLVDAVTQLVPKYLEDPIDYEMSKGSAALAVIDASGRIHGQIYGGHSAKSRWYFGIANRKVLQVWSTGYATGRFEELVFAGQLDDAPFGIERPDFIGWQGGVPLRQHGWGGQTDQSPLSRDALSWSEGHIISALKSESRASIESA